MYKKSLCDNTYHCVISTVVTHIQERFIGTLAVFVTQTLDSAVRRCPTKVTHADFRSNAATLHTALGTDGHTGSESNKKLAHKAHIPSIKLEREGDLNWMGPGIYGVYMKCVS